MIVKMRGFLCVEAKNNDNTPWYALTSDYKTFLLQSCHRSAQAAYVVKWNILNKTEQMNSRKEGNTQTIKANKIQIYF